MVKQLNEHSPVVIAS